MDEIEARSVLSEELSRYRALSYSKLLALVDTATTVERAAPSGTKYQIEMQVFFDDRRLETLRILGAVDDFSLRKAISPLCDDFIIAPDGSFIGE